MAQPARPFQDRVEAVILKGRDLPASILGAPLSSYRVFADYGSGLETIPMQVEERDENGIILVTSGPHAEQGDGKFNEGDELVFMAWDAGGTLSHAAPEGCKKSLKVTIKDKQTGSIGYVMVAQCDDPPPLSTRDYVSFDPDTRTVISDLYQLGWKTGAVYPYDHLTINDGPDLLDRLKVRCSIGKWGVLYTFQEDHFHHTYVGYTDGPVRVTWKAENYWSLGPLGKIPVPQYQYFYRDYMLFRNALDAGMNPALFGLDFFVTICHDMTLPKDKGYKVCANMIPDCESQDQGLPAEKVEALTNMDLDWGGISGQEGAIITRLVVDPGLTARVIGHFVLDEEYESPPEYHKGSMPTLGFKIVDWKNVKPDIYDLMFYHYLMDEYSTGECNRIDRLVTNPLEVRVSE
jgi:hypothetical protein